MNRKIQIIIFIFNFFYQFNYAYEKESKCLSEKSNLLTIACPANKITRIIKAFYGYSWSGDCHFIEKDCTVDVPNDDLSCLGEGCSVKIIDSPIILQECWSLMASYIQVDYECIGVEQLQNMCNVQESDYPVGYIVTPDYPSTLKSELSCPCTLQAPTGYTITMEVLDFRMASCAQTGLTVWSDSSTYTHCSAISTGILPGSGGQNISMRLHSQSEKSNAGFLLKYFASPQEENIPVKFICYGSSQYWQTNTLTTKTTTKTKQSFQSITSGRKEIESQKTRQILITTTSSTTTTTTATTTSSSPTTPKPFFTIFNFQTTKVDTERVLVETTSMNSFSNSTHSTKEIDQVVENTKSFRIIDFKEERFNDWTVIIISVVASVIFLLIMINALIWFIFSIKSDKKTMSKKLTNTIYSEQFFPQNQEYFKSALSNDDIYMSSASGNPINPNSNSHHNTMHKSAGNLKDSNHLWKSAESLNAFAHHYLSQQPQIPTTTWPRGNGEFPNLISHSMPYGFNFEKGKRPKKYKLSKEEKKRLKEWEFLQDLRLKKIKDDEMQQFLSNSDANSAKFIIPNEYNQLKAGKINKGANHWANKYPKMHPNVDRKDDSHFENPALIIDDERVDDARPSNLKGKNFRKRHEQHEMNMTHNNHEYLDNMSRGEESMVAFSDAAMLKSASQVPVNHNMQNPNYLYEEQEGSIDLRSEYSFYSKNPPKSGKPENNMNNNISNINKKSNDDNKAFCEYKDISSWRDVY